MTGNRLLSMARFYFDFDDGETFTRDERGVELEDVEAAKAEAVRSLPTIAKDELPDGDRRTFVVIVRDAAGRQILTAQLSLVVDQSTT